MTTASDYRFYKPESGDAEPIYCGSCGAEFHCEENLRRHWRVHRRARRS